MLTLHLYPNDETSWIASLPQDFHETRVNFLPLGTSELPHSIEISKQNNTEAARNLINRFFFSFCIIRRSIRQERKAGIVKALLWGVSTYGCTNPHITNLSEYTWLYFHKAAWFTAIVGDMILGFDKNRTHIYRARYSTEDNHIFRHLRSAMLAESVLHILAH